MDLALSPRLYGRLNVDTLKGNLVAFCATEGRKKEMRCHTTNHNSLAKQSEYRRQLHGV